MIPQAFIQDLVARVDIVDLIQKYVPLKKAGANYQACCPFHSEKSPSFTVSPTKQFYHCFGCGAHGTAVGFLMEYAGFGFIDAIKDLAQQIGVAVPEEGPAFSGPSREQQRSLIDVMTDAAQYYRDQLKNSPRAVDYLKRRGLTGEIAARFGIGYAPNEWQGLADQFKQYDDEVLSEAGLVITNEAGRRYDRFRDRIMFPILDQRGNVIAFGGRVIDQGEPKYLNSPETPLFEKGRELYGLSQARIAIRETDTVIVVEGYMDVVALAQFGVGNAVATLGTATTPTHVQKLLRQASRLVFCFDGDKAGRKAARRGLDAALAHLADDKTVAFLFLPEEHDPDSYVREHGADAFQAAAQQATPLGRFLLDALAEECELGTAEGRAKLVHLAKESIPKVSAPVLRMQLVRELAHAAQLSPEETAQALGLAAPPKPPTGRFGDRKAPPPLPRAPVAPFVQKLLRLLLARPELGSRVPFDLLACLPETSERDAVIAIMDAGEDGQLIGASLGVWFEHFRDSACAPAIATAMRSIQEGLVNDDRVEDELTDTLRRLELLSLENEIKTLTGSLIRPEDQAYLQQLFAKKQKLKSGQPV
ncbi:DNA primase [Niveibacterium sp. SC-1]|uniref:DNA primase n=1 Tax=Niveibacterium sp. SC-1 TaxID=3135646 RepID=UPI00311DC5C3